MSVIELRNPHWLPKVKPEHDLCAHGGVKICVNEIVISDGTDTEWTVSASALYLLRTIKQDHTKEHPVCENLIPHCGFAMFAPSKGDDVIIIECPNGINFEVKHIDDEVVLINQKNEQMKITTGEWKQAVFQFADAVENFYQSSQPKQPERDDNHEGYKAFWAEWKRRRYGTASLQYVLYRLRIWMNKKNFKV
jgi:hypothetical protein